MSIRLAAAMLPLAVGACANMATLPAATVLAPAATSQPAVQTPATVAVEYTARAITDPGNWRDLNDAQSPDEGDTQ